MSEAARQVGQWIDQYGPQIQFAPGTRPTAASDPDVKKYLKELKQLQQEMEAHAATLESAPDGAQAAPSDPQAVGPLFWLMLAKFIIGLIGMVAKHTEPEAPKEEAPVVPSPKIKRHHRGES